MKAGHHSKAGKGMREEWDLHKQTCVEIMERLSVINKTPEQWSGIFIPSQMDNLDDFFLNCSLKTAVWSAGADVPYWACDSRVFVFSSLSLYWFPPASSFFFYLIIDFFLCSSKLNESITATGVLWFISIIWSTSLIPGADPMIPFFLFSSFFWHWIQSNTLDFPGSFAPQLWHSLVLVLWEFALCHRVS